MKFRATIVVEYDAPDNATEAEKAYGCVHPNEMAAVDESVFKEDNTSLYNIIEENKPKSIKVEPVSV